MRLVSLYAVTKQRYKIP